MWDIAAICGIVASTAIVLTVCLLALYLTGTSLNDRWSWNRYDMLRERYDSTLERLAFWAERNNADRTAKMLRHAQSVLWGNEQDETAALIKELDATLGEPADLFPAPRLMKEMEGLITVNYCHRKMTAEEAIDLLYSQLKAAHEAKP